MAYEHGYLILSLEAPPIKIYPHSIWDFEDNALEAWQNFMIAIPTFNGYYGPSKVFH